MNKLKWIIILLLLSCKSAQTNVQNPYVFLSMEKTECMGKCPVYKVDFYNDGSVLYTGKKNVLREGDMKFNLKQSELSEIKNKAEALNFFELQDKYIADVTDLPTTILVYNSGEREKTVVDYYNAPNKLKEFEERLEEIVFSYL